MKDNNQTKNLEKPKSRGMRALIRDTRGLNTVEYAILLALIVAAAFGTWKTFGGKIAKSVVDSNTAITF